MKLEDEDRRPAPAEFIGKIFAIVMVVLYLGIGTTILFEIIDLNTIVPYRIPETTSRTIGILFIVYGAFRAFKFYRRYYY